MNKFLKEKKYNFEIGDVFVNKDGLRIKITDKEQFGGDTYETIEVEFLDDDAYGFVKSGEKGHFPDYLFYGMLKKDKYVKLNEKKFIKSMKESKSIWYIAFYGSSGDGYIGYDNEPTNDFDDAMQFNSKKEAEKEMKILQKEWGSNLRVEEFSLEESKKSLKESRGSILDKEFYDLVEKGYIYDEDENGMNMSYGEYASVSDDLWEVLADELKHYHDFLSAYDAYEEIMNNTGDDAKMFMSGSDNDFYFSIDEDEGTYTFGGEVPFVLEKLFKKFQKETDLERA